MGNQSCIATGVSGVRYVQLINYQNNALQVSQIAAYGSLGDKIPTTCTSSSSASGNQVCGKAIDGTLAVRDAANSFVSASGKANENLLLQFPSGKTVSKIVLYNTVQGVENIIRTRLRLLDGNKKVIREVTVSVKDGT